MVSETDTGQCASEDTEPQRGVDTSGVPARALGPRMVVDCEIPERGTSANEDAVPQRG